MRIAKLSLLSLCVLLLFCVAEAECENKVDGFRLGQDRQEVTERIKSSGLDLSSRRRPRDGLEVLEASDGSIRFWVNSERVVGISGKNVRFKGKEFALGISESDLGRLLGPPDKVEEIKTAQDILGARHAYFHDGSVTLLTVLGDGTPRDKPEWVVSAVYLFEDKWL